MNVDNCGVCFQEAITTYRSIDKDEKGVKWTSKMRLLVPELEEALNVLLCNDCAIHLNEAVKFREQLAALALRQQKSDNSQERAIRDDKTTKKETTIFSPIEALYESYILECASSTLGTEDLTIDHSNDNSIKEENTSSATQSPSMEPFHEKELDNTFDDSVASEVDRRTVNRNQIQSNETILEIDHEIDNTYDDLPSSVDGENVIDRTQKQKISFVCITCNSFYASRRNLHLHEIYCGKKKGVIRSKKKSRKNDKRLGGKLVRTFSCEICYEKFNYIKLAREHCIKETSIDKNSIKFHSCEECSQRFSSSSDLEKHKQQKHKIRHNVCSRCGKSFITSSDLAVHEKIHFNRRNYKCIKCGKAFNTNKNLRMHILIVHTDPAQWKHQCDLCSKRFPLKAGLVEHKKRHSGEKTFSCHICSKSFVTTGELKRHIVLHSNIKAFKCEHCQKDFKYKRTLNVHMASMHGMGNTKPPSRDLKFECHICHSKFYAKQKLSRHLNKHLGIKPFECNLCKNKFIDKYTLDRHMKFVHQESEMEVLHNVVQS